MSVFDTEREQNRRSREAIERAQEAREQKGNEPDEEIKAAAILERADYLVREVKNSKTQMQNIILHIQQVMAAVKELREQLQIEAKSDGTSIAQDKRRVDELKKRIGKYADELIKMKDDLVREQVELLRAEQGATMSAEFLNKRAEELVAALLQEVQ